MIKYNILINLYSLHVYQKESELGLECRYILLMLPIIYIYTPENSSVSWSSQGAKKMTNFALSNTGQLYLSVTGTRALLRQPRLRLYHLLHGGQSQKLLIERFRKVDGQCSSFTGRRS